jgi:quercetin dioxygenase-like cupin family protein
MSKFHQLPELQKQSKLGSRSYHEFIRVPAMSAGLYILQAGAVDSQQPHKEAEIYYVVAGRAQMLVEGDKRPVQQGTVIFVAAGEAHRFLEIEEELVLLVVFAPAES